VANKARASAPKANRTDSRGPIAAGIRIDGLVLAVASVIVGFMGLIGTTVSRPDATQPAPAYCATVVETYRAEVQGNPQEVRILTDRTAGQKSIIESDRSAVACDVTAITLAELAELPKVHN
jgi:hypothetical protein